jgi:transposase
MAQPGADPIEVGKRFGVGRATVYKYLRKVLD